MNLVRPIETAFRSVFGWMPYTKHKPIMHHIKGFYSARLGRAVEIDIFLPPDYYRVHERQYSVLFFNDGQDMPALHMADTLELLYTQKKIEYLIIVAVHANENRLYEYGTAGISHYKGYGNKASAYSDFITEELFPYVQFTFRCRRQTQNIVYAGCSLGGLSALDIVWHHPHIFGKVGIFSASLWWRSEPFDENNPDNDRIMHNIIRNSTPRRGLKFWFEAGTQDEESDRNRNGIIDAIDDTLDIIKLLREKNYTDEDLKYVEVQGGTHDPDTWARIMPDFLKWAFPDIRPKYRT